jgi:hypothetical protein
MTALAHNGYPRASGAAVAALEAWIAASEACNRLILI